MLVGEAGRADIEIRKAKKWPWWLSFLKPHTGSVTKDYIVRCECGRAMWLKSSQAVRRHHVGGSHQQVPIQDGSVWEFIKMKTGLLRLRTLDECFRDLMQGRE
jgi:hypothetical protein